MLFLLLEGLVTRVLFVFMLRVNIIRSGYQSHLIEDRLCPPPIAKVASQLTSFNWQIKIIDKFIDRQIIHPRGEMWL